MIKCLMQLMLLISCEIISIKPDFSVLKYKMTDLNVFKEEYMPEYRITITVRQLATMIKSMNDNELETLLLLLSDEGNELLNRNNDLKEKKVKYLSRDEAFDV